MNAVLTRGLIGLTVIALFALHHPAPPDLSSPKATVQSFVDALEAKDAAALSACVEGAKDDKMAAEMFRANKSVMKYDIKDMVVEVNGDTAKVAVKADTDPDDSREEKTVRIVEIITLKKEGENWRITPDPETVKALLSGDIAQEKRLGESRLNALASLIGSPDSMVPVFAAAKQKATAASCMSNGSRIVRGLIMYLQDYDEEYPPKKSDYVKLIAPYVKNQEIFTCSLDPAETVSYSFNKHLEGMSNASVNAPASTILLYEGKDMKPDYRHDGMALIAFADGHVKMCTPEMVRAVSWTPDGKPGAPPPLKAASPPAKKPAAPPKPVKKPKKKMH